MENMKNNMGNTLEEISVNAVENNMENTIEDTVVNAIENNTENTIEDAVDSVKNNVIELKTGISTTGGNEVEGQASLFDETAIKAAPNGQFGFDLFGDDPNEEKKEVCNGKAQKNASQQKSQKNTNTSTKPTSKPALEKITVNEEWTVCYAAQRFQIHEFFDGQIPEGGVSLEELRQKMEQEFFELSQGRTFWDHDKERKLLFPIVKGTSKG